MLIPTIALEEYICRVKCRVPEERSAVLLSKSILYRHRWNAPFKKYLIPPLPEPPSFLPSSLPSFLPPSLLHAQIPHFLKMICEDDLKVLLEAIRARLRVPNSEFVDLLFKNAISAQSATCYPDDTSDLRVEPLGIHRSWIVSDLHEEERLLGARVALFSCSCKLLVRYL